MTAYGGASATPKKSTDTKHEEINHPSWFTRLHRSDFRNRDLYHSYTVRCVLAFRSLDSLVHSDVWKLYQPSDFPFMVRVVGLAFRLNSFPSFPINSLKGIKI